MLNTAGGMTPQSHAALTPASRIWRWLILIAGTVVASIVVRSRVASAAEVFWCLFPVWLVVATWGLHLFPFPPLPKQSRFARIASLCVLTTFPAGFYITMVVLTRSVWSWKECAICVYFFSCSLECLLLVYFAAFARLNSWLQPFLKPIWYVPALIVQKSLMYAILVPFLLVVFAVHRPKLIPHQLTDATGQNVETVRFPARDGLLLRGVFLAAPKSVGTVIVCHGVGANHADIEPLLIALNSAGYQALAFDFRGHGASAGHTITYGLQERRDVLGAYDYCLTRQDVSRDRLLALGVSMGGASLLQALPEMPLVRAAVVDSAFASLELMAEHQLRFVPSVVRAPMVQVVRGVAWIETGADIRRLAPAERLRDIHIPLLIVHGGSDVVVPTSHAHLLHGAATGPVQIFIEPDAPHIGSVGIDPTGYIQRVKRHFSSAL